MRLRAIVLPTCSSSGPRRRPEQGGSGPVGGGIRLRRAGRVDAVDDHLGAVRRHQSQRHQLTPRRLARACHDHRPRAGRPARAVRDGAAAATRWRRRRAARRKASVSWQVTTTRPRRQRAHQVRVAVIDEVKHVGADGLGAQPPRVVVEAVDDAIDREGPAVDAGQRVRSGA